MGEVALPQRGELLQGHSRGHLAAIAHEVEVAHHVLAELAAQHLPLLVEVQGLLVGLGQAHLSELMVEAKHEGAVGRVFHL